MESNNLDDRAAGPNIPSKAAKNYEASAASIHESIVLQGNQSQITVGGITLQSTRHGPALVNLSREVTVRRRQAFPDLRQRLVAIVNRNMERSLVQVTQPGMTELVGDVGSGRSSLLNVLSHELANEDEARFSDGYAYIAAGAHAFDELLFEIWSIFYEADVPWTFVPPIATLRLQLTSIDSLLMIDDPNLSEAEFRSLDTALVRSNVLVTLEQPLIGGFGQTIFLRDMSDVDLLKVAEDYLVRMSAEHRVEERRLNQIVATSAGNPGLCIRELGREIRSRSTGTAEAEIGEVISVTQTFSAPVPSDVLEVLTGLSSAPDIAAQLANEGELQSHSPRYTFPWKDRSLRDDRETVSRYTALMEYMANELDLSTRPDAWALAQETLEWMTAQPPETVEYVTEAAQEVAVMLCDVYMASGYLDRWKAVAEAMGAIAKAHGLSWPSAWSDHQAGAAALCKGEWIEARTLLERAATGFISLEEHQNVHAIIGLLGAAIAAASNDGDDYDNGFGSKIDDGPTSPQRGADGSAREFKKDSEFESESAKELAYT